MRYQLAGSTHRGAVRDHNEDAIDWVAAEQWALAVVADGIGGYNGGALASSLCVERFVADIEQRLSGVDVATWTPAQMQTSLRAAGQGVNRQLKREQRRQVQFGRMGTTLVAGLAWGDYLCVIHAGDSRCYRLRRRQLAMLTRDHTYVAELAARGELDDQALRAHPLRHVLTRSLGRREPFEFAVSTRRVEAGDIYLFCSDGLSNCLAPAVLKRLLGGVDRPAAIAAGLIDAAQSRARDNISAVVMAF
ncbi:PP2C family protein-serine/threonine phosphatase [Exilibacterium tricleocarpae]|uniref:PP2C family protein-serine/threonine phosphatase n=1 Tax=Exilibacterium tricleocarpae TaxID=2591008 RepID=UPI0015D1B226|nr:protein phosphatase 2C domain-containing protein [Exilibacterium tricleocarpae]